MNKKLILNLSLIPLLSLSMMSMHISYKEKNDKGLLDKEEQHFLINSEIARIKRIIGLNIKYIGHKIINGFLNEKYFFVITNKAVSIIDINTTVTIQVITTNDERFLNENVIYANNFGLLIERNNGKFESLLSNQIFSKEEIEKNILPLEISNDVEFIKNQRNKRKMEISTMNMDRRKYGTNLDYPKLSYYGKNKFNVSHVVPHAWWFATRNSDMETGYIDFEYEDPNSKNGLCEYVALSQLLLYNHLFIDASIFSEDDFDKYIQINWSRKLEHSSPVFKHIIDANKEAWQKLLPYKLYESNERHINLKNTKHYWTSVESIIGKNNLNWKLEGKYAGYYQAWKNVRNGYPVILGVAPFLNEKWFDHAYLMYGYDDNSDMFLGTCCFGGETNIILYSYWTKAYGSYYFTLKSVGSYRKLKENFFYKDRYYYGPVITTLIESETYNEED
ncbi:putative cysteine peptidase [[Mycoplasma] anseris]|uniref:Uncharacterized protein n=1 Tax=[Mycoplasma] anseris TaxID=92400 RepID=A0A2Z4NDL9_9BACT|nr:hypothetical protein [[Mycoplasma] anseris]AWX69681.1 hypothetical protein DP065_02920 [[Mycoplasma] anseris]